MIDHCDTVWQVNELSFVREQANKAAHAAGLRSVKVAPQERKRLDLLKPDASLIRCAVVYFVYLCA